MSFDTPLFAVFLTATILFYRFCPKRFRWALLLAASIFFYACWSPPLTLVILGVIVLSFISAKMIANSKTSTAKKGWLIVAITGCLGLLFWFKYFNFLMTEIWALFHQSWTNLNILLPVGCSFYTFQALSYVIDVYRGKQPAVSHFGRFSLFICFFPQLVAGPIERTEDLLPQLEIMPDANQGDVRSGFMLLLSGFFRKIVIADTAAAAVNRIFAANAPDGSAVLLGLILFSFQIYCDFAGYSEIAQGSARLMGIHLKRNFDQPYLSRTVRSFWRRWHISLSDWFTDYVYIPLGGNRKGKKRQILATLAVFALS
ncbi:MAG: MBOAT family protein [Clostridia bacterium]|nr:MBOAT family protein [Clostridia bacterium]